MRSWHRLTLRLEKARPPGLPPRPPMPSAAPKPCTQPGCRRLIPYGEQCPDHPNNWRKQDVKRGNRHERGYGNDWTRLRNQIMLRDKGLCVPCQSAGRVSPATEVDHIVPKAQGGTDAPGNLQAICPYCHKTKTAYESTGATASAKPEWLPTPRIPVVVVCGPPGSGKLDYAKRVAEPNDLIVDVPQIASAQTGKPIYHADRAERTNALRARNALLAGLAHPDTPWDRAIVTMVAGSPEVREWWRKKLNASVVVMDAPKDLCRGVVRGRGLPAVQELEQLKAIDAWV